MKPYIVDQGTITTEDLQVLSMVKQAVAQIPNLTLTDPEGNDEIMNCHLLSRVLGKFLDLQVYDGYFCKKWEHSWLVVRQVSYLKDGFDGEIMIDPYPIASAGGPVLLEYSLRSPWLHVYSLYPDGFSEKVNYEHYAPQIEPTVENLLIRLGILEPNRNSGKYKSCHGNTAPVSYS